MTRQLIIGFCTEGTTDQRFLQGIIERTFSEIAYEAKGQIEIFAVRHLEKEIGPFNEVINVYASKAFDLGISILCVHSDADASSDQLVFNNKIKPAFNNIHNSEEADICKNLVAIVPIYMTEAWMLADKTLLKEEINTAKTNKELGIDCSPESIAQPKTLIKQAINIARKDMVKRRRGDLTIADLYQSIGTSISLDKLEGLSSYRKFKESVREVFRQLNYL